MSGCPECKSGCWTCCPTCQGEEYPPTDEFDWAGWDAAVDEIASRFEAAS